MTREEFPALFTALRDCGYALIGPTLGDQAIVYDSIQGIDDLPIGWTDEQDAGRYRLRRRDDNALFGYNLGPQSWKALLYPPALSLWKARKTDSGFEVLPADGAAPRMAFIGARPCELHAIAVQDRVLSGAGYADPHYVSRRQPVLIIAVQCSQAGGTCFCGSLGTGPRAVQGFDLALTELIAGDRHEFVIEVGSEAGAGILARVPHRPASEVDWSAAQQASARAARQMQRHLDPGGLKALLYRNAEHPRWEEVARRCLACGNCTMVCPTCFCTAVEDVTALDGRSAERLRRWDSCFNRRFAYIHGGSLRDSVRSRYRQWLTHKLASWQDQFGSSGCVGCGRCITWCPVGIDITEEVAALRANGAGAARQQGLCDDE
jgi:ferredoxin